MKKPEEIKNLLISIKTLLEVVDKKLKKVEEKKKKPKKLNLYITYQNSIKNLQDEFKKRCPELVPTYIVQNIFIKKLNNNKVTRASILAMCYKRITEEEKKQFRIIADERYNKQLLEEKSN